LVADRALLKITEEEFSGSPLIVSIFFYLCLVFIGIFWALDFEYVGGDWTYFRIIVLYLGCFDCAWEVFVYPPRFWREQVNLPLFLFFWKLVIVNYAIGW